MKRVWVARGPIATRVWHEDPGCPALSIQSEKRGDLKRAVRSLPMDLARTWTKGPCRRCSGMPGEFDRQLRDGVRRAARAAAEPPPNCPVLACMDGVWRAVDDPPPGAVTG